ANFNGVCIIIEKYKKNRTIGCRQVESASQADFFKMLDEKIAHVSGGIFTVINYIYANGY
uniref:Uncharacterized protein n=1 Tax=Parascaris equorum TaxID=6256 RepID=A0A914RFZ2_PAREQ